MPEDQIDASHPDPARALHLARKLVLASVAIGVAMLVVVAGVLYVIAHRKGKLVANAECPAAQLALPKLDLLAHGELAALSLAQRPALAQSLRFNGPDGQPTTLAAFKGKTILLNLWATWCVPCRQEMPALDQLQAKLGDKDFAIIAVNIDTARLDRPKQFLEDAKITHLPYYSDAQAQIFQELRASHNLVGLPATLLIDSSGCEIGVVQGPAKWDSGDAQAFMEAAKGA